MEILFLQLSCKMMTPTEKKEIEYHPLEPFLPKEAKVLMLGTFPPAKKRWSMDFFYPNFQNDMWRIMGLVFFGSRERFIAGKRFDRSMLEEFCREKGIALSDTARAVIRLKDNASDKFLEIVEPVDLSRLLAEIPHCRAVVTTGQKATDTLISLVGAAEPDMGSFSEFTFEGRNMRLYRMPSSSRAYPKPVEKKAAIYAAMFRELDIL